MSLLSSTTNADRASPSPWTGREERAEAVHVLLRDFPVSLLENLPGFVEGGALPIERKLPSGPLRGADFSDL